VPDPKPENNSFGDEPETNWAVALSTFTLAPATVTGGKAAIARFQLTDTAPAGDAILRLTSSRPDIAPVPATFVIPNGTDHREFPIIPAVVSAPTTVQVTASFGLVTITRTLTVVPPALKQFYLNPTTVIGGCATSSGKVVLTGSAPAGGAVVPLTNTNTKATVPANVTVPVGSDTGTFSVSTVAVTTNASGTVRASYGGVSQALSLGVRPIRAQLLSLASSRVRGGTTVSGTVTLECPAAPGAVAVSLTSSNSAVAQPTQPSITLPAGATTGTFSVRTTAVTSDTSVTIYAWVFGVRKGVTFTVTP
jgi:trimeric autotransporter adhesin